MLHYLYKQGVGLVRPGYVITGMIPVPKPVRLVAPLLDEFQVLEKELPAFLQVCRCAEQAARVVAQYRQYD
jgi:hypothetical protein